MANTVKQYANSASLKSALDKAARTDEFKKFSADGIEFLEVPIVNTLAEFGATADTCAVLKFPDNTLIPGGMIEIEKTTATDVDSDNDAVLDIVLSDASDGTGNVVMLIDGSTALQAGAVVDITDAAAQRAFVDASNKYLVLILQAGEVTAAPDLTLRLGISKGAALSVS